MLRLRTLTLKIAESITRLKKFHFGSIEFIIHLERELAEVTLKRYANANL